MGEATALARGATIWLVPFAIVVAALGFETDWGRSVSRDVPAPAAAPPPPVAVALLPEYRIDGGVDTRKETVDRVLFNPTRRPAPPASQTAAASAMKRGQYTLTGTTVVGNVATAFLRDVNGGKSRSVRQGETLGGMLVAEIRPDRVRLKQGDDFEDLSLKVAAGPRTTVQAAPVIPPTAIGAPQPGVPGTPAAAAAAAGAGGTGATAARPTTRQPAPPVAGPAAGAPGARPGVVSVGELLAERRRAARAAAEAAAANGPGVAPAPAPRPQ